ncbi:MAG: accessory gene regulator B family protein [Clostridium sp.]|nr:accessory gene regulator B family protein [Clostridium sp.]
MTGNHLWEKHIDQVVQKLLQFLGTREYGETVFLKVDYSLRVIISGMEKTVLLCILFGITGYLKEFLAAFGVIIMLRSYTGGMHRKTITGCFLQSLVNLSLIIFLGNNIMLKKGVCVFAAVVLIVFILYFAPIQSEDRMLYSKKQRMGFKGKALVGMAVIFASGICVPQQLYNTMMFAVFFHMFEMVFLCVRIQKKEVNQHEALYKANN